MEWTLYAYDDAGKDYSELVYLDVISSVELEDADARVFMSRLALYLRIKNMMGCYGNEHLLPFVRDDKLYVRLAVSNDEVIEVVMYTHDVKSAEYPCPDSDPYHVRFTGVMVASYRVLSTELIRRFTGFELDEVSKNTDEVKAYVNTYVNEFIADYMA